MNGVWQPLSDAWPTPATVFTSEAQLRRRQLLYEFCAGREETPDNYTLTLTCDCSHCRKWVEATLGVCELYSESDLAWVADALRRNFAWAT